MTRPSDIPQDAWDSACNALARMPDRGPQMLHHRREHVARAIMAAKTDDCEAYPESDDTETADEHPLAIKRSDIAFGGILAVAVIAWGTVISLVSLDITGDLPFPLFAFPLIWLAACLFCFLVDRLISFGLSESSSPDR